MEKGTQHEQNTGLDICSLNLIPHQGTSFIFLFLLQPSGTIGLNYSHTFHKHDEQSSEVN